MSSRLFNISKGRTLHYFDLAIANAGGNEALLIVYAKEMEADALLRTRTSYADIFAELANTVCDFDNYAVQLLTNVSVNITDPEAWGDSDNSTILAAGSAGSGTNNTIVKAVLFYTSDSTSSINGAIPLCHYDYGIPTNGNNLEFRVPTDGLVRLG